MMICPLEHFFWAVTNSTRNIILFINFIQIVVKSDYNWGRANTVFADDDAAGNLFWRRGTFPIRSKDSSLLVNSGPTKKRRFIYVPGRGESSSYCIAKTLVSIRINTDQIRKKKSLILMKILKWHSLFMRSTKNKSVFVCGGQPVTVYTIPVTLVLLPQKIWKQAMIRAYSIPTHYLHLSHLVIELLCVYIHFTAPLAGTSLAHKSFLSILAINKTAL